MSMEDVNKIYMLVLYGGYYLKFNSIKWYEENFYSCKLWLLVVG